MQLGKFCTNGWEELPSDPPHSLLGRGVMVHRLSLGGHSQVGAADLMKTSAVWLQAPDSSCQSGQEKGAGPAFSDE